MAPGSGRLALAPPDRGHDRVLRRGGAPNFNAMSVAGAHFRDAGANAAQEMAFTLADAITYCDEVRRARSDDHRPVRPPDLLLLLHPQRLLRGGRQVPGRAPATGRTSCGSGTARRTPARACSASVCVCGGWTLQAQQPLNNIVRVAYQAMAAVLGGVQSMFTVAWDEPFALPTEETTDLRAPDPAGAGVRDRCHPHGRPAGRVLLRRGADRRDGEGDRRRSSATSRPDGGMVRCIENGYVQRLIADERPSVQPKRVEPGRAGDRRGQQFHPSAEPEPGYSPREDEGTTKRQLDRLAEVKAHAAMPPGCRGASGPLASPRRR